MALLSNSFGLERQGLVTRFFACNHVHLNRFCYLGWKIEIIKFFFFFFFFHLEKQILSFCNKCLSAKFPRVTYPVGTHLSHHADS